MKIKPNIVQLLFQCDHFIVFGENVHPHQLTERDNHLIDVIIVADGCFPCDAIQHIKQKVRVHLSLQGLYFCVFQQNLLLI